MTEQNQARQSIETKIIAKALEDEAFRQELLNNPNTAKAEIEKDLGQKLPEGFQLRVLQETENMAYIVLPVTISANQELSEEQMEAVAGGWKATVSVSCKLGTWCVATGGCV